LRGAVDRKNTSIVCYRLLTIAGLLVGGGALQVGPNVPWIHLDRGGEQAKETSSAKSSGAGTNRVIWILAGLGALTWFGSQVVQRPAIAPSAAQTPPSVAGTRSTQVAARAGTPATERPDAVYLAGLAALDRGDYQQAPTNETPVPGIPIVLRTPRGPMLMLAPRGPKPGLAPERLKLIRANFPIGNR
jgi:hypothetical protein